MCLLVLFLSIYSVYKLQKKMSLRKLLSTQAIHKCDINSHFRTLLAFSLRTKTKMQCDILTSEIQNGTFLNTRRLFGTYNFRGGHT